MAGSYLVEIGRFSVHDEIHRTDRLGKQTVGPTSNKRRSLSRFNVPGRPLHVQLQNHRQIQSTCKNLGHESEKMTTAAEGFIEIRLPEQKSGSGYGLFPTVLSPNPSFVTNLSRLTDSVKKEKPWLEDVLLSSGAILLRDFPVQTASDFNAVVEAFGYEELPYVGGAAPRTNVVGRVFTANESPPDQKIPFHHEMAQVPEYPAKLFFFCEEEPGRGGETPIVLSHLIYERMKERFPEFVEKLEDHGLIYTRVLGAEDDPSSPIGRGWQSTFLTKDKRTAEESMFIITQSEKIVYSLEGGRKKEEEGKYRSCMGKSPVPPSIAAGLNPYAHSKMGFPEIPFLNVHRDSPNRQWMVRDLYS